jgi:ABC transport system ATP-binding/permease protein
MHLVSVDGVAAEVDGRALFADASFGLTSEDRVGVVGPNGSGKSTLLAIIARRRPPEDGEVVHRSGLRVGWLSQTPTLPDAPALQVVLEADAAAREHEAAAMLDRLDIDPERSCAAMSGGQRRRVALAGTLLAPADLLVLDEPTNHLDVDTIDWLEQELSRRACGLVMVTHDRYVLERVTNRMLDVLPPPPGVERPGEVVWHEGSYSSLLEARAERAEQRAQQSLRARNLLRKEVAWLRRRPKARTTKPQFRLQQVEQLREAAAGEEEARQLELGTGRRRLGKQVFHLEQVGVTRGEHRVLDGVDLGIGPGERVGLVGPNGSGKSTLLHLLAGRLTPDEGQLRVGETVVAGLYEQEAAAPPSDVTALDTVLEIAPHVPLADGRTLSAGRLAERFGFDARTQRTPVELLSGGERRRLALLHLLVAAPNVLLLDEPTNDLDLDTLSVLEDHLDGFAGTLVVASHDRYLLDRLTDRLLAVEHGTVTEHLDWDDYRARRRPSPGQRPASQPAASRDDNRQRQAARKQARSLERRVAQLEARRDELHHQMSQAASEPDRLLELQREAEQIAADLAEAEDAWLQATVG